MDHLTTTNTTTTTTTTTATTSSPETDTETHPIKNETYHPQHPHHINKVISFSNGTLKHYHNSNQHQHQHQQHVSAPAPAPVPVPVVVYKQCRKNHAASLGGQAFDGCGEFMPSPAYNLSDPSSLKCAACGCHRNFHLPDPDDTSMTQTHIVEYRPLPIQPSSARAHSPNSASPPPISSPYYPSGPQMLLALSSGKPETNTNKDVSGAMVVSSGGRKRFRTKFSAEQKDKMFKFAEKVGWKMQKRDEELVNEFCNEVGVSRTVLKVWMHNNKLTFGKKDSGTNIDTNGHGINGHDHEANGGHGSFVSSITSNLHVSNIGINGNINHGHQQQVYHQQHNNGSSSSS